MLGELHGDSLNFENPATPARSTGHLDRRGRGVDHLHGEGVGAASREAALKDGGQHRDLPGQRRIWSAGSWGPAIKLGEPHP
jgi:hypothetical protein